MNIKTHVKKLIGLSLKRYTETHLRATNNRIDNIVAQSGNDNSELVDARIDISGVKHPTLNRRITAEVKNGNVIEQEISGSHISVDTNDGYVEDLVIEGNTIQDENNLSDIRSVGDKIEGQELYKIPLLCTGKNLYHYGDIETSWNNNSSASITGWVKVKPNTTYTVRRENNEGLLHFIEFIDSKKSFKNHNDCYSKKDGAQFVIPPGGKSITFITSPGINYIMVTSSNNSVDSIKTYQKNIQLEEGTVVTPYEPYQEHKLTILSPTQIEKVGDVADRIIEKDGVWGVEKNNVNFNVQSNIPHWGVSEELTNSKRYTIVVKDFTGATYIKLSPDTLTLANIICDKLKTKKVHDIVLIDEESIGVSSTTLSIRINNDKLTSPDSKGLNEYITKEGLKLLYTSTKPQFIPLPNSQQIKLRTLPNKTNISFLTEIEGTIKGKVPKSLSATVNTHTTQIDNLNTDLERVKRLEESTVSTVKNDGKDFVSVESTNQGYFEDVRLEGKTLVNYSGIKSGVHIIDKGTNAIEILPNSCVTDSKVRLQFTCNEIISDATIGLMWVRFYNDGTPNAYHSITNDKTIGHKNIDFVFYKNISSVKVYLHGGNSSGSNAKLSEIMLIDFDDIKYINAYHEGLKSVGEGTDEIEVSSCNENLFNFNSMVKDNSWIPITKVNDLLYFNNEENINKRASSWFRFYCNKGDVITVKTISESSNYIGLIFSKDTGFSEDILYNKPTVLNTTISWTSTISGLVYFRPYSDINSLQKFNCKIMLNKGTTPKPYTPHKSNKKPLLRYNDTTQVWEKPILREWDYAEKRSDGEYYNVEKSGQVVLNGSENWNAYGTDVNTIGLSYNLLAKPMSDGICDIIPFIKTGAGDKFHCMINNSGLLLLWIEKNKLETQDVVGFKKWLQTNPATVTYQLATPKEYKCTNIDLISHPNETNLYINSGPITPNLTAKYHGNIANTMIILQNKVNLLENKFMAGLKSVLAGNMQDLAYYLYPDDFVTSEEHETTTLPL